MFSYGPSRPASAMRSAIAVIAPRLASVRQSLRISGRDLSCTSEGSHAGLDRPTRARPPAALSEAKSGNEAGNVDFKVQSMGGVVLCLVACGLDHSLSS